MIYLFRSFGGGGGDDDYDDPNQMLFRLLMIVKVTFDFDYR